MTRAAATDTAPDAERTTRGERGGPPGLAGGRRPGPESPRTPLPAAATLLAAELTLHLGGRTAARQLRGEQRVPALLVQGQAFRREHVGDERWRPPRCLLIVVMLMTSGEPCLDTLPVIVIVAFA